MRKIKLLIVDDNPEVAENISKYFNRKSNFEVIGIAYDAMETISIIDDPIPDVILLDLIMPRADGFYLLEQIRKKLFDKRPKIIILSCLNQESVINRASTLGADFYIVKPYSMDVLYNRIVEICAMQYSISAKYFENDKIKIQNRISDVFNSVGMPVNTLGRKYLLDCVLKTIQITEKNENLSKNVYPSIALAYDTKISNIERSIRHTLELTWKNYQKAHAEIFGFNKNEKPSNKQFIEKVAQQLISEGYRY